jgi:cytochrome b6
VGRRGLQAWLEQRLPLAALRDFGAHKTVPIHRYSVFYYLGGMTLLFFAVQVVTGILLMLYYNPGADGAFESVAFIVTTVPFGWLIRSVHSWSANLMIFFAALHLVSVFFVKAYRAPRELTWLSGCLLFFLLLAFGFSGYLLPWNELALFATKVGTDIAGALPGVGDWVVRFLRGGDRVSGATLSRFYGWHVAILPAVTTAVLAFHLVQVQLQGMSLPPAIERSGRPRRSMPFVPDFLLRDVFGWVLALGVLAALAAIFPWELGEKADPFAPAPADIRPEWYFVFMFETLKLFPGGEIFGIEYEAIPILLFGLGALALCAVPFLDRGRLARGRPSPVGLCGALALIYVVATTAWGYRSWVPLLVAAGAGAGVALLGIATRAPAAGRDR